MALKSPGRGPSRGFVVVQQGVTGPVAVRIVPDRKRDLLVPVACRASITRALGVKGATAKRALAEIADHGLTYRALDIPPSVSGDEEPQPHQVSAGPDGLAVRYMRPRGRPSRERLGILVNLLALTWERYRRQWPGRSYRRRDEVRERAASEDGPFVRFARECIAAIDPGADYPSALVRRVIRGRVLHEVRTKRRHRSK
jgi:hypothetical protein